MGFTGQLPRREEVPITSLCLYSPTCTLLSGLYKLWLVRFLQRWQFSEERRIRSSRAGPQRPWEVKQVPRRKQVHILAKEGGKIGLRRGYFKNYLCGNLLLGAGEAIQVNLNFLPSTSLAVQCLRLCSPIAGATGSIPGQGTKNLPCFPAGIPPAGSKKKNFPNYTSLWYLTLFL